MHPGSSGGILFLGFNQDFGCFCCGTNTGFRVYNCDPFKETFCRGFDNGGIGIVEMLFRCNILAIVGGGPAPKYPPSKVMIWDDHQGKCIGELSFRSQVRAVRLRRDRVVVALELKVLVYNFADLKLLHQIETLPNLRGLVALSSAPESTVLACPGLHPGQVRVELYDRRQTKFISAHTNALSCLALSLDGKRLATASDKGTLVRVWNTTDGQLLQELRRGAEQAVIHSIALSRGCEWLAVSSDKGTVHIFSLSEAVQAGTLAASGGSAGAANGGANGAAATAAAAAAAGGPNGAAAAHGHGGEDAAAVGGGPGGEQGPGTHAAAGGGGAAVVARSNPTSLLGMVKGLVPAIALPKYFASEWSWAQFRIPSAEDGYRSALGFSPLQPNTLFVITSGGSFYKVSFDPAKGGTCLQEAYTRYLEPPML